MSSRISPESLVGTELVLGAERWHLTQYLASGGLAHLYLARALSPRARPTVGAKVLRSEVGDRREARARAETVGHLGGNGTSCCGVRGVPPTETSGAISGRARGRYRVPGTRRSAGRTPAGALEARFAK